MYCTMDLWLPADRPYEDQAVGAEVIEDMFAGECGENAMDQACRRVVMLWGSSFDTTNLALLFKKDVRTMISGDWYMCEKYWCDESSSLRRAR